MFGRWRDILDRWTRWCDERGVSLLAGALAFVRSLPSVERLVIGVDCAAHLEEILAVSLAEPVPPDDIFSEDRDLIDPSRWKVA
jgi:aryl-alcohol dehydrogenase-like predicted oxidoreductase